MANLAASELFAHARRHSEQYVGDDGASACIVQALEGLAHEIAALREEIARTPEQRRLAAAFAPPAPVND